jgi:hypothetical protein
MRRAFVCDMAPVQQETIPYAEQIRREQEARAAGDAGEGGGEPPGVHSRLLGRFALDGRYAYGLRAADDGAVHVCARDLIFLIDGPGPAHFWAYCALAPGWQLYRGHRQQQHCSLPASDFRV